MKFSTMRFRAFQKVSDRPVGMNDNDPAMTIVDDGSQGKVPQDDITLW